MRRVFSFTNFLGLLVLIVGVFTLQATQSSSGTRQLNLPSDLEPGGPKVFKLHYSKETQDGMVLEARTVTVEQGEDLLGRAIQELIKPPTTVGAAPLVPVGTPVPTVFLREDTAIIDLPAQYANLNYGIAQESALIYGMASTLLEFKEVKQVKFLLQGKGVESLGHISLVDPFQRQKTQ